MKRHWKSLNEYNNIPEPRENDEINNISAIELLGDELTSNKASRRDFLKWCGFSVVSASVLASCESPLKKAIPYLNQPEEVTPGMANWYATSFYDGKDFCPIVVKVRDGRPIKIEGNDLSPITGGGTHARVQAAVLSLYDTAGRYHHPFHMGKKISWEEADSAILSQLEAANADILILTSTIISPSTKDVINGFIKKFPRSRHVMYDAVSYAAMREANVLTFGRNEIPFYRFDKAELIVGFNADFLANWLLPVTFAKQYAETRRLSREKKTMSLHLQFESGMSLTGSNADERFIIRPSEEKRILSDVYRIITGSQNGNADERAVLLAGKIVKAANKSLIVSGTNDIEVQALVNAINFHSGSYGNTIDFAESLNLFAGSDKELIKVYEDMKSGKVSAVIVADANPVYDYPSDEFKSAFASVPLKISLSSTLNETAEVSDYILPASHLLESWDDLAPAKGSYGVIQPVIRPLFETRQMQDSLLKWSGSESAYKEFLKEFARQYVYPRQEYQSGFNAFWNDCLQQGFVSTRDTGTNIFSFNASVLQNFESGQNVEAGNWSILLYESTAIGDGRHANNPWLQELPDPVTKICWDNFAAISPSDAETLGLNDDDVIVLKNGLELPVTIQPGQAPATISVAIGYGRSRSGKVAEGVGKNVIKLSWFRNGLRQFAIETDTPVKSGRKMALARTQTHHSMEGRALVRESVLPAWLENPASGNELHEYHEKHKATLYPKAEFEAHHWALAVDLNSCIGCSACVIACQAENNIPVIGKREVMRRRIMHWIRLDRYYTGKADNPKVVHQPVMCQHCDNAPCENVCPVAATTHSDEGINQITYNRCVGTKYCIANCPYKVRRFNWFEYAKNKNFDYHMNDDIGRLVLNPDVTVRERGVVEKCSFCIQRIQENKLNAKLENRQLRDGDVKTACMQACPAKALVFGDLNDPESEVSKLFRDERNYHLLEELHTLPSVGYLTKIRNSI